MVMHDAVQPVEASATAHSINHQHTEVRGSASKAGGVSVTQNRRRSRDISRISLITTHALTHGTTLVQLSSHERREVRDSVI